MCGIAGLVLQKNEVAREREFRQMVSTMSLRGPDSQGIYLRENIGFGHQRLKVIDLSDTANQPMQSQDGKVVLIFNGEIYNYQELRKILERDHARVFVTASDTEVILQAYEVYGTDSFSKLNGMFSFAILDLRSRQPVTYLVRDHFGIKPLFYSQIGSRLAFASELKPLMCVDWIRKDIDPDSIFYFLKFSHVPCPKSIFRDVSQVEPGTFLKFSEGTLELHRYFEPREVTGNHAVNEDKTEAEWLTELESCFKNVMKRQLISDVPLGAFLSGGVDSSLLTLIGTEVLGRPMDTFTIAYGENEFDESSFASAVAKHANSNHHEIRVRPQDLFGLIEDLPKYFDQPLADPTLLPSLILARESRKHVTVALSGDGGDELFFGYPYQKALLSLKSIRALPPALRKWMLAVAEAPAAFLPARKRQQWLKLKDILRFRNDFELLQYFIGTIGPVHLDRLRKLFENYTPPLSSPMSILVGSNSDLSWRKQVEQVFLRTFMTDTVLAKTDRSGMAFGLEGRVPFLDDEMVAFSARLPDEYKTKNNQSKYLLRKLLENKMPGGIAFRKKRGFSIPLREWLKGDLQGLTDRALDANRLKKEGIFSPTEIASLVNEYQSGEANHSHLLFSLLTFQNWKEYYRL